MQMSAPRHGPPQRSAHSANRGGAPLGAGDQPEVVDGDQPRRPGAPPACVPPACVRAVCAGAACAPPACAPPACAGAACARFAGATGDGRRGEVRAVDHVGAAGEPGQPGAIPAAPAPVARRGGDAAAADGDPEAGPERGHSPGRRPSRQHVAGRSHVPAAAQGFEQGGGHLMNAGGRAEQRSQVEGDPQRALWVRPVEGAPLRTVVVHEALWVHGAQRVHGTYRPWRASIVRQAMATPAAVVIQRRASGSG